MNVIVIASFLRRSLIVALTVAGTAAADVAHAQAGVSHAEDATPIPGGTLRMSIANVWTRYDSRFDSSGVTRPIGAYLSTDSLGPRQLPNLAPIEQALGVLTGDARTRLTFGRLDVRSDARIVRTPIALEYGVTRRLSIGVLLPLVQTRRTAQARVNLDTALAVRSNVGIVPSTGRADVATANLAAVTALNAASAQITQLLSRCQQSPGAAECDPVRGREAAAAAAASSASAFATAVGTAYGTTPQTAIVAPRSASPLAAQIEARRAALVTQLRAFVPSATVSPLFTAPTELSYADFQGRNGVAGLLQSRYGGGLDSIRTTERVHIGDVELRARLLLIDRTTYDTSTRRGLQTRLAVGGSLRFATSVADTAASLLDIGTGDGAGAEVRSALDLATRRMGLTVAARYAKSFARTVTSPLLGFVEGEFPLPVFGTVSSTSGDVVGLDLTPRIFLGEWMAFEGQYGLERRGGTTYSGNVEVEADPLCLACAAATPTTITPSTSTQLVGFGLRYSTVDAYLRGRARYPIEVSYRHLEAITGDAGLPKLTRDQIQLRIFYRVRGR